MCCICSRGTKLVFFKIISKWFVDAKQPKKHPFTALSGQHLYNWAATALSHLLEDRNWTCCHCYVAILFTYPQTINSCNGSVSKIKASNVFLNSFQKVSVQFTSKNTCIEKFTKKLLSLVQNNQHPLLIRSFHLSTHPMLRLLLVRMRLPANTDQWRIQNPVKHARWSVWRLFGFQPLTVFAKNFILHV